MEAGDFVTIHLQDPKEQYWGRLLKLFDSGVVLRGIGVKQIEAFKFQFNKEEKRVYPQTAFFPMRRVEHIALDEPVGTVPAVIEDILQYTGLGEAEILSMRP